MRAEGYGRRDLMAFVDSGRGVVEQWLAQNIVKASIADTAGRGFHRRFTFDDLVRAAIAAELAKFSIPTRALATLVPVLDSYRKRGAEVALVWLKAAKGGERRWEIRQGSRAKFAEEMLKDPWGLPPGHIILHLDLLEHYLIERGAKP